MFNTDILYKEKNPGTCKTLVEFMCKVVKSWTAKHRVQKEEVVEVEIKEEEITGVRAEGGGVLEGCRHNPRAPYKTDPEGRLSGKIGRHKLENLMSTSRKSRLARKCRVCARRGSETKMWCVSCQVPLHPGKCFTVYHTKLNCAV